MKLTCDVCGNILTETGADQAVCSCCGMEYGPERLQELRIAETPTPPEQPKQPEAQTEAKKPLGCGTWFLLIMALLDLVIGTHGIVAVFCLLILWIASWFSHKK